MPALPLPTVDAPTGLALRPLEPADSIAALTELLHRAYAALAERGMRYSASHQDEETTRRRAARGECWVATLDSAVVATITFHSAPRAGGAPWYDRPDVASFGQFGVEPTLQGRGIGSMLMDLVERRAAETGAAEIACDTSEHAHDLIAWYERRGYRSVGHVDWRPHVNYRSVLLSKRLGQPRA